MAVGVATIVSEGCVGNRPVGDRSFFNYIQADKDKSTGIYYYPQGYPLKVGCKALTKLSNTYKMDSGG